MSNAANTDQYKQSWNDSLPLFLPVNFKENIEYQLSEEYSVCVSEYAGKVGSYNLRGSECGFFKKDQKIAAWRSIDNRSDFYKLIRHSNGYEYLIFRQDLYGYSVLNIILGEIVQFYPEESLNGRETFIWTDVEYNPMSNVLAVSGCYWACPYSIHLLTFDDPISENQRYVDMIECFDGGYDIYDDVDFIEWVGDGMRVTRYNVETDTKEEVTITQKEYLEFFCDKGKEL